VLLEWYDQLDRIRQDKQDARDAAKAAGDDRYLHGKKSAIVAPSINGSIKKRRAGPTKPAKS
jgi:hypothetical protein